MVGAEWVECTDWSSEVVSCDLIGQPRASDVLAGRR